MKSFHNFKTYNESKKTNKKPIAEVKLKGDSIWSKTKGLIATVTDIDLDKHTLLVYHDLKWDIYTDSGFEKEITKLAKETYPDANIDHVTFSEQGQQMDGVAHMDVIYKKK